MAATLDAAVCAGRVAWCDGGDYDRYWRDRLYQAAGREPAFRLCDWSALLGRLDSDARTKVLAERARRTARHRARPDTEALLTILARALGAEEVTFGDLAPLNDGEGSA